MEPIGEPGSVAPQKATASRIVGAVLTAVLGLPFLVLSAVVLGSRFEIGEGDPHGFVLIFGSLLAIPLGLVLPIGIALIAPPRLRGRVFAVALVLALMCCGGLFLAFATA
jgi:hypothetical protein